MRANSLLENLPGKEAAKGLRDESLVSGGQASRRKNFQSVQSGPFSLDF